MRPLAVAASFALFAATAWPAAAQLIPDGAEPEKVADGYRFTEGPAAGPDGCIYFTDIPAELILKYDPETGETETFREETGQANGLMWYDENLFMCCHRSRTVSYYLLNERTLERNQGKEQVEDGLFGPVVVDSDTPQVVADSSGYMLPADGDGERRIARLNSPNDLTIDRRGNIYFTDPRYGNRDSMEIDVEGVYYFGDAIREEDGREVLYSIHKIIIDDLTRPNGIVLSPDESILYVADNGTNEIFAYDVTAPGEIENKRLFARLNNGQGGGADGMCVDALGRLYAAGQGRIWVYNPDGSAAGDFAVGRACTNCTFGPDGKTLYITANRGLYRIELNTDEPLPTSDEE